MNIREQFWQKALKKEISKEDRPFVGFGKIRKALVIYDEGKESDLERWRSMFESDLELSSIVFCNAKSRNHPKETAPNYWFKNQHNWYFKPKSALVSSYLQKDFDILIDLSNTQGLMWDYFRICARATMKINFGPQLSEHYHLNLRADYWQDPHQSKLELVQLLKRINQA